MKELLCTYAEGAQPDSRVRHRALRVGLRGRGPSGPPIAGVPARLLHQLGRVLDLP